MCAALAGLIDIDVGTTSVTDYGVSIIGAKLPRLRKLSLSGCKVNDAAVTALLSRVTQLHDLNLNGCGAATAFLITALARVGAWLRTLSVSAWREHSRRDEGRKKDVGHDLDTGLNPDRQWGLTDKCLFRLAMGCPLLSYLDISGHHLTGSAGVRYLEQAQQLQMVRMLRFGLWTVVVLSWHSH